MRKIFSPTGGKHKQLRGRITSLEKRHTEFQVHGTTREGEAGPVHRTTTKGPGKRKAEGGREGGLGRGRGQEQGRAGPEVGSDEQE